MARQRARRLQRLALLFSLAAGGASAQTTCLYRYAGYGVSDASGQTAPFVASTGQACTTWFGNAQSKGFFVRVVSR
jgi:hypothetical protein